MRSPHRIGKARQLGFSLIEIMVGLVIGMLAVLVIMQVFSTSEAAKRNTTGGGDAQIGGTIALYSIERDLRESGYGLSAFNVLGCSLTYMPTGETSTVTLSLAPTTIKPATSLVPDGDANTDTLLVMYGSSNSPSEGDTTMAVATSKLYQVTTPSSFAKGDFIVAQTFSRPSPCNGLKLDQVTAASATSNTLSVTTGQGGLAANSVIYNLGKTFTVRAYAVRNGNLTVCDYTVYNCGNPSYASPLNSTVWVPADGNIVSLRAQYGHDTSNLTGTMSGVVDTFDQKTPGTSADTSGLTAYCSWARTLAVRVALVSRSPQYDKTSPTAASPSWAGSTVVATASAGNPANQTADAVSIDLSNVTNWQNYRYKTLQTTVPLRNIVWQGSQGGC